LKPFWIPVHSVFVVSLKIIHNPSTIYGTDLASRVATILDRGFTLAYGHREYCGMGLGLQEEHYCYSEVWDGRFQELQDILSDNQRCNLAFNQRSDFVAWLASQSDISLAGREEADTFYHDNQTVNHKRLMEFLHRFESIKEISLTRWNRLWQAIPATGDSKSWFGSLMSCYDEEHRHYHTLHHLNDCLMELDSIRCLAQNPVSLEMALWFHDAIYETETGADNEGLSADMARDALEEADAPDAFIRDVCSLILLTKKHLPDDTPDAALMCDIDLAILGQDKERFQAYENAIRQEYAWVPLTEYIAGRSRVLESFLSRPKIYATETFQNRYEAEARCNLRASLERLAAGI